MEILKKFGNLVKIWKLVRDLEIWKKEFENLGKTWKFEKKLKVLKKFGNLEILQKKLKF